MYGLFLLVCVSLVELVHTSCRVDEFHLAGVERVARGADFNTNVLLGGTGRKDVATGTADCGLFVLGMDTFLHGFHLSHQISVKRQTALPLVQTPRYSITARPVLQVFFLFFIRELCFEKEIL